MQYKQLEYARRLSLTKQTQAAVGDHMHGVLCLVRLVDTEVLKALMAHVILLMSTCTLVASIACLTLVRIKMQDDVKPAQLWSQYAFVHCKPRMHSLFQVKNHAEKESHQCVLQR